MDHELPEHSCSVRPPEAYHELRLLRHDQVVVLFYEIGHAVHDLVSRTIYARFHGLWVPV